MSDIKSNITQDLIHYVDDNYDNYNTELTVAGVVIDICPIAELYVISQKTQSKQPAYPDGFPDIEYAKFGKYKLPLLKKETIIANNLSQSNPDPYRIRDAHELQKLI